MKYSRLIPDFFDKSTRKQAKIGQYLTIEFLKKYLHFSIILARCGHSSVGRASASQPVVLVEFSSYLFQLTPGFILNLFKAFSGKIYST